MLYKSLFAVFTVVGLLFGGCSSNSVEPLAVEPDLNIAANESDAVVVDKLYQVKMQLGTHGQCLKRKTRKVLSDLGISDAALERFYLYLTTDGDQTLAMLVHEPYAFFKGGLTQSGFFVSEDKARDIKIEIQLSPTQQQIHGSIRQTQCGAYFLFSGHDGSLKKKQPEPDPVPQPAPQPFPDPQPAPDPQPEPEPDDPEPDNPDPEDPDPEDPDPVLFPKIYEAKVNAANPLTPGDCQFNDVQPLLDRLGIALNDFLNAVIRLEIQVNDDSLATAIINDDIELSGQINLEQEFTLTNDEDLELRIRFASDQAQCLNADFIKPSCGGAVHLVGTENVEGLVCQ